MRLVPITESVDDPHVMKVIFLAGGGGSGKSFIGKHAFSGTGLKVVNSDPHFERLLKNAGIDTKTAVGSPEAQALRPHAKRLASLQKAHYTKGRVGLVIDGTGAEADRIAAEKRELEKLGYDTHMVFVDVPLDVALERNRKRDRVVPEEVLKKAHIAAQKAKAKYKKMFGGSFVSVSNSGNATPEDIKHKLIPSLTRTFKGLVDKPVKNPIGRKWIRGKIAGTEQHPALRAARKYNIVAGSGKAMYWRTIMGKKVAFDKNWKPLNAGSLATHG